MGCIQGVECEPHVDSLLLTGEKGVGTEARNVQRLIPIDQRAAEHHDATAAHDGQLVRPEAVPEGVIRSEGTPV